MGARERERERERERVRYCKTDTLRGREMRLKKGI